ncbi:MAG: MATE family efflux transporter [Emergencia sp.]
MMEKTAEIKENKMAVMPVGRLVLSMSLPLMISLLVQSLYNIVDGIFVARISEDALTATSLAYPVQLLMIAVAVGTGVGVNALISQRLGAGKQKEAWQAATDGLLISLICSAVFMAAGALFADHIAEAFADNETTADLCGSYLRICMVLCPGIFMGTLVQRLLQSTGNTFLSMISLISGAVVNIALDPVLIFGLAGCPAMGIRGAAWATAAGQWVAAVAGFLLNWKKNPELRFIFRGFRPDRDTIAAIYKVGVPTIVMQALGSIMVSAVNWILMPFSSTAVTFFGAYYKLQSFLFMPMHGLGQATIPIIGFNFGAGSSDRIMKTLKTALPAAAGIALAGTVIFEALPRQLLSLFAAGPEMMEIGVPALRIISVTFVFGAVSMILGYSASGLGNGVINMIGTALRQLVILVPAAYLLARSGGIGMVWYAMWIAEGAGAVYCILAMKRQLKKVKEMMGRKI